MLFMFKYLNFTLTTFGAGENIRSSFNFFLSVTIPAGVSFYTFHILSYSLDVASGKIKIEKNPLKMALYVTFFPQLIAGPIPRYWQIESQLEKLKNIDALKPDIVSGIKYVSYGMFVKVFIADRLFIWQDTIFYSCFNSSLRVGELSSLDVLFNILAYSYRIYFDFWAYSIIAIGLGKFFCIELPRNFNEPYISLNPKEFWRRWHMTLSFWLKDYVYLPLGGNKKYVRNIMIIFLACGLWHGAGWRFVIWGAYHAFFVILYHFFRRQWDSLAAAVQTAITFTIISFGWPLFFHNPFGHGQYQEMLGILFSFRGGLGQFRLWHWAALLILGAFVFFVREEKWLYNEKPVPLIDSPVFQGCAMILAITFFEYSQTFIYFRF